MIGVSQHSHHLEGMAALGAELDLGSLEFLFEQLRGFAPVAGLFECGGEIVHRQERDRAVFAQSGRANPQRLLVQLQCVLGAVRVLISHTEHVHDANGYFTFRSIRFATSLENVFEDRDGLSVPTLRGIKLSQETCGIERVGSSGPLDSR